MKGEFSRLVLLEGRSDGVRAVQVPRDVASVLQAWAQSADDVDPVEFLREHLRKKRLPPPPLRG